MLHLTIKYQILLQVYCLKYFNNHNIKTLKTIFKILEYLLYVTTYFYFLFLFILQEDIGRTEHVRLLNQ